jgi:hypothetical protein
MGPPEYSPSLRSPDGRTAGPRTEARRRGRRTGRPESRSKVSPAADPLLRAGRIFASGRRYPERGNSETATPSLRAFFGGIHLRGIAPVYSHPYAKSSEISRGLSWAKLVTLAVPAGVIRLVTTETTLPFLVRRYNGGSL